MVIPLLIQKYFGYFSGCWVWRYGKEQKPQAPGISQGGLEGVSFGW